MTPDNASDPLPPIRKALARRKELYEALHPETKKTGPRTAGIADNVSATIPSFAADTAAATGQSERQVRRDVAIGLLVPVGVLVTIALPWRAGAAGGLLPVGNISGCMPWGCW